MESKFSIKIIILLCAIVVTNITSKITHQQNTTLFKEIDAKKLRKRVNKRVERKSEAITHREKLFKAIKTGDSKSVKHIIDLHKHLSIHQFTITDPKIMKKMKKLTIGQGLIPLNIALIYGKESIAKELATNLNNRGKEDKRANSLLNANDIAEDNNGNSPFHLAVILESSNDLLQFFIDLGADVNDIDDDNESSLFDAVRMKNFRMVRFLVEKAKANTLILNKNGDAARTVAYKLGFTEIGDFITATYKAKGFI